MGYSKWFDPSSGYLDNSDSSSAYLDDNSSNSQTYPPMSPQTSANEATAEDASTQNIAQSTQSAQQQIAQTGSAPVMDSSGNLQPDNSPLSQQSFSNTPPLPLPVSPVNIQPTFVPGIGALGLDIGGAAKGAMMAQDYLLKNAANTRAEEQLGMSKVELGQKQDYLDIAKAQLGVDLGKYSMVKKTFDQEQEIRQGVISAAQQGGYAGVINYLMTADPAKAVEFQAEKLKLDAGLMQNQVLKAQMPNQINQALFDSYAVGGKLSAAIMNAPPDQRAALYKTALPLFKTLNPNAPDELNQDAVAQGMLYMAQAAPESALFAHMGLNDYYNTELGKLNLALASLQKQGLGISPQAQQVQTQIDGIMAKTQQTQQGIANAQMNLIAKQQDNVTKVADMNMQYQKALNQSSQNFLKDISTYQNINKMGNYILQLEAQGKTTAGMQGQLQMALATLANGGKPSDKDADAVLATAGLGTLSKNVRSWLSGEHIVMNPWEVKQAVALTHYMMEQSYQNQLKNEAQWQQNATQFINPQTNQPLIDWSKMPLPSQRFQQTLHPQATALGQGNQPVVRVYNPQTGQLQ